MGTGEGAGVGGTVGDGARVGLGAGQIQWQPSGDVQCHSGGGGVAQGVGVGVGLGAGEGDGLGQGPVVTVPSGQTWIGGRPLQANIRTAHASRSQNRLMRPPSTWQTLGGSDVREGSTALGPCASNDETRARRKRES